MLGHSSIEIVRSSLRDLSTKVLEGVIMLIIYYITIMNSTCQIYKRFNLNYILKKICVKTDLICMLTGAHILSISIILSSLQHISCLCILNTVRLMLNT